MICRDLANLRVVAHLSPCCFISAPDAVNNGLVSFDLRSLFFWLCSGVHTWTDAPLSMMINSHSSSSGQRSILPRWHSPLSSPQRAKPRTWGNPFGRGLSPCRRNTSYSTGLTFLPSACPGLSLCPSLCPWPCLCLCPS